MAGLSFVFSFRIITIIDEVMILYWYSTLTYILALPYVFSSVDYYLGVHSKQTVPIVRTVLEYDTA